MYNLDKLVLIKLQIQVSYLWNVFINLINNYNSLIFSSIVIVSLLNFGIWPNHKLYQILFIIIFISVNFYLLKIQNKKKINLLFLVTKKLEEKINFKNSEIFSYFDELGNMNKNIEGKIIWKNFKEITKQKILSIYKFRIDYFLITVNNLRPFSIVNIILVILVIFNFKNFSLSNINNSLFGKNSMEKINNFSTNIWIYPPPDFKKDVIFFENFSDSGKSEKNLLLIKGSKIVINVYSLPSKDVVLKLKKEKNEKKLNLKSNFKQTSVFEEILEEGEYMINIKGKTFLKLNIKFDKEPKITFNELPIIINNTILKFSFNLNDENNDYTFLSIRDNKNFKNLSLRDFDISEHIGKISKQHGYNIILKPSEKLNENYMYNFYSDLDFLPFYGDLNLNISSFDKNKNFYISKDFPLKFGSRIFNDKIAIQIISIRNKLYEDQNLNSFKKNLSDLKNNLAKEYSFVNESLMNLIIYVQQNQVSTDNRIQKALMESWNIAVTLEKMNLEFITKEILKIKSKLEKLINTQGNEKEIEKILNQLEKLLEKFEKNSFQNEESSDLSSTPDNNEVSKSLKKRADEILDKIDQLIGDKKKINLEIKEILNKLETVSKKQKELIEKTFLSLKEESKKVMRSNEQKNILNSFVEIEPKIKEYFPEQQKIVESIKQNSLESLNKIDSNKLKESITHQKIVLKEIEEIIKSIKENSKERKKNKRMRSNNKDDQIQFDVPIIFEKNTFDTIIAEIKRLANENNNDDREKEYLKKLLPKF